MNNLSCPLSFGAWGEKQMSKIFSKELKKKGF